jgi:hypothetical protein
MVDELLKGVHWGSRWFRRSDILRLGTAIGLMEIRLRHYVELCRRPLGAGEDRPEIDEASGVSCGRLSAADLGKCERLLGEAKSALTIGAVDSAWMVLNELEREMVMALSDAELKARLTSAQAEAGEKLGKWRGSAVKKLPQELGLAGEPGREAPAQAPAQPFSSRAATLAALRETMFHLHNSSQNLYHNIGRIRRQVTIASLSVAVMVVAVWVLNANGFFDALGGSIRERIPLAVLSGLLGGVLSVAHNVSKVDPKLKIPEVRASFLVTLTRPIVGAAVALPILVLIESGLINIPGDQRIWAVPAFCFLGGFSERWFFGIVEKLEKPRP